MTRISNVDQMLALLRQQLQQMSKSGRTRRSARTGKSGRQQRQSAAARVRMLAAADDISDQDLAQTLVAALLIDEFGEGAANDHRFQKLVGDVHRIIGADPKAELLMAKAVRSLTSAEQRRSS